MEKDEIIDILNRNEYNIESGNWEEVYESMKYDIRGDFSRFLIQNGIDINTLFKKYIPRFTFDWCSNITSFTLSTSIKEIGDRAFNKCTNLTSINLENSVEKIGQSSFSECESLESITVPSLVQELPIYAFWACTSLKSITLSNGLKIIGQGAFAYCRSLKSITLPNSLQEIGYSAFGYCNKLKEIKYDGEEEWKKVKKDMDWLLDCPVNDITFLR